MQEHGQDNRSRLHNWNNVLPPSVRPFVRLSYITDKVFSNIWQCDIRALWKWVLVSNCKRKGQSKSKKLRKKIVLDGVEYLHRVYMQTWGGVNLANNNNTVVYASDVITPSKKLWQPINIYTVTLSRVHTAYVSGRSALIILITSKTKKRLSKALVIHSYIIYTYKNLHWENKNEKFLKETTQKVETKCSFMRIISTEITVHFPHDITWLTSLVHASVN